MSYTDLYFARKISGSLGFARHLWMPKLPRAFDGSPGSLLLGSLVEEVDGIGKDFPLPFPLTIPQILLKRLEEERNNLQLPADISFVLSQKVANTEIVVKSGKNLAIGAGSNLPGLPTAISFGISNNKLANLRLSLNEGAEIQFIPKDFITRFYRLFQGKDSLAFPNIAMDVDDHLFVDLVVLANSYSVIYEYDQQLGSRIDGEIDAFNLGNISTSRNPQLGPQVRFNKINEFSVAVNIQNGMPYLLGFRTVDWDDL